MKKLIAFLLALVCALGLAGCNRNFDDKPSVTGIIKEIHDDHILIATSTEEGYPYGASFDISVNIKDCDAIYKPLAIGDKIVVYYDGNMLGDDPVIIDTVYAITLESKATHLAAQYPHFAAKILEIHDNYLLVEPEVGMEELKSADKFEVPLENAENPTELQVGDSVLIIYDGEILETYPAKLGEVYKVGKLILKLTDNDEEAN